MGAFKNHFGLWFFNGALLKDEQKILINAQEGKTNAMRQMRFTSIEEIKPDIIKAYVEESIQNLKDGLTVKRTPKKLVIPKELENAFDNDEDLKSVFESLPLSHKREFAEYVASAKKEETRLRRLDKIIPMIKEKKGLNDKYK